MNYSLIYQSGLPFKFQPAVRSTFAVLLFLVVQYTLKTQQNNARLSLEKEQLQTENYKAQIQALHARIDPHFLFNSLNTLRSMVRQQHTKSEKFVMSLSDFYRQTLKHTENTSLQLSEELVVLQSYLFLMQSRNEEASLVKINIDKALHDLYLPTLALQTVVENCFKHNSMTSKNPLQIEISNIDGAYVEVKNNIQTKIGEEDRSGYGLELLRKRYELMKVSEGLIVQKTPDHFIVRLKLISS
ncbi:MAG: histidine kinase [Bacteroidota bacterium]